jgi:hypothetical protein
MGLHRHHSDRAALCHVVPFRLWASGGEPPGSKHLWDFCGARQGTDGHGACARVRRAKAVVPQPSSHQVRPGGATQGEQTSSARIAR